MKGILLAACTAVVAMLVVAGCGSDDETTASLTRAQFIQQGNAICKKGEEERGDVLSKALKLVKPGEELKDPGKENLVATALIPQYKKMTKGLSELEAPEGDEEEVEAIIEAMEQAAKDVEEDPLEAFENVKQFAKANKLNTDYGLTNCVV